MPAGTAYCIEAGMLASTLTNVDLDGDGRIDHVRFEIRNQFLHPSHPLGWIRKLAVRIDDRAIAARDMLFVVRGQRIVVEHLPTITDIWWHMREVAEVYVRSEGLSGQHRVSCDFEVSLFTHTPAVDREDLWPRLTQSLSVDMQADDGGSRSGEIA